MSREIKHRGKRVDNGEWVYGSLINTPTATNSFKTTIIDEKANLWYTLPNGNLHINKDAWNLVIPETVGQYTGLKDGTKWEQLTEKEKLDFYNRNKSEDGISIKYRNVDDVKYLWKGKEIYDGDIITGGDNNVPTQILWVDEYGGWGAKNIRRNEIHALDKFFKRFIGEVIGNIHEELLEVENEYR